jgi:PAS domain S-box-containing protein
MIFRGRRLDFPARVRLTALLLLLFLSVMLLATTYLFRGARDGLERELEDRATLMARLVLEQVQALPLAGPLRADGLAPALPALHRIRGAGRAHRIVLWGPRGERLLVVGPALVAGPLPAALARPFVAWGLTDFYEGADGGWYRALHLPIREAPGTVRGFAAVEVQHDFLGFARRIRWWMFGGYALGLVGAIAITAILVGSVLRPYTTLTRVAERLPPGDRAAPALEAADDMAKVVARLERAIDALPQKEAELARFYAMEEERARRLQSYQEDILGNFSSGIISVDPTLRIVLINRIARQILGLPPRAAEGRPCAEVFGADGDLVRICREALEAGRIHSRLELEVPRADGSRVALGLSSSLLPDPTGGASRVILLLADLTESRRAQAERTLKESLAALGEMSAGIAHEFRNSLGTILGFARLLERALGEADPRTGPVREILAEIHRLEAILKDFLAFARPAPFQFVEVELHPLLEEVLGLYRGPAEEAGVRLEVALEAAWPLIRADPLSLRQALGNLVRNGLEAMAGGGELRVRTLAGGAAAPGMVAVVIEDTGSGIPAEDLPRIFAPFFTTKEGGTGLGLALAQKTVVGHGGRIEVHSVAGRGSRFTVTLPLVPVAVAARSAPA